MYLTLRHKIQASARFVDTDGMKIRSVQVTMNNGTASYCDGLLNDEDGPAIKLNDGTSYCYADGQLQNPDRDTPAIVTANGDKFNLDCGILSATDRPAITLADGTEVWVVGGVIHKDEGPAIVSPHHKVWVTSGKIVDFETNADVMGLLTLVKKVSELVGILSGPIGSRCYAESEYVIKFDE